MAVRLSEMYFLPFYGIGWMGLNFYDYCGFQPKITHLKHSWGSVCAGLSVQLLSIARCCIFAVCISTNILQLLNRVQFFQATKVVSSYGLYGSYVFQEDKRKTVNCSSETYFLRPLANVIPNWIHELSDTQSHRYCMYYIIHTLRLFKYK